METSLSSLRQKPKATPSLPKVSLMPSPEAEQSEPNHHKAKASHHQKMAKHHHAIAGEHEKMAEHHLKAQTEA